MKIIKKVFISLSLFGLMLLAPGAVLANHIPYNTGDVFAGVGNGQVYRYDQSGVFIEALNTTSGSLEQTGMAFDSASNLYTSNWTANSMSKFDNMGGLLDPSYAGPFNLHPESIVFDASGNMYVGQADGSRDILKFDASGTFVAAYNVATTTRGADWIDLAADQCTMFYTSEGGEVKRFDVCTNTQLADFAGGLTGPCFALRIRDNGEVLVTCRPQTYRLSPAGAVLQTYPIPGENLFAMNLDPDGNHFWTGGYNSRNIYRVNITTGVGTGAPVFTAAAVGPSLAGLAIYGEPTVAVPDITLSPLEDENPAGTDHMVTAEVVSGTTGVEGVLVTFSVESGPNVGQVSDPGECSVNADCTTDINGQVSWIYTSNGVVGTDVIVACFTDQQGTEHCARARKTWVDNTGPVLSCRQTVNPHGQNVPKASKTNEDGFYQLLGKDNVDPIVALYVSNEDGSAVFGPFSSGDNVKITEAPGATPTMKKIGSSNGQANAVINHIILNSDAIVTATDLAGNTSSTSCLVPPPPK